MRSILIAAIAVLGVAGNAAAHGKIVQKHVVKHVNKTVYKAPAFHYGGGIHFGYAKPSFGVTIAFGRPAVVVPTYHYVVERAWIEPVYRSVLIGHDACYRPIYRTVVVQPGCWREARYRVCSSGSKTFVGYL